MKLFLASLALAATASLARTEEKVTLDQVKLGDHVFGPNRSANDLKGRVVLLEFWAIQCGPCLAAIPQLVKLQEELKDSGFVIVAAYAQAGTNVEISAVCRKYRVNYTVIASASVPAATDNTLPKMFLFDSSGKMVEKGGTDGAMLKKIRDLVAAEPHFLAAGKKYTVPKVAALADALKKTSAYGQILKKLDPLAKGDGVAADEAKDLKERIEAYGARKMAEAKALEADDAFAAVIEYNRVAASFTGASAGDGAKGRLKELKADEDFQNELKAGEILHQMLAECEKLVATQGTYNLDAGPNKKIAGTVRGLGAVLKKKCTNSKAANRMSDVLKPYGFKD